MIYLYYSNNSVYNNKKSDHFFNQIKDAKIYEHTTKWSPWYAEFKLNNNITIVYENRPDVIFYDSIKQGLFKLISRNKKKILSMNQI